MLFIDKSLVTIVEDFGVVIADFRSILKLKNQPQGRTAIKTSYPDTCGENTNNGLNSTIR